MVGPFRPIIRVVHRISSLRKGGSLTSMYYNGLIIPGNSLSILFRSQRCIGPSAPPSEPCVVYITSASLHFSGHPRSIALVIALSKES